MRNQVGKSIGESELQFQVIDNLPVFGKVFLLNDFDPLFQSLALIIKRLLGKSVQVFDISLFIKWFFMFKHAK